jgi:hypothetical protein
MKFKGNAKMIDVKLIRVVYVTLNMKSCKNIKAKPVAKRTREAGCYRVKFVRV